MREEYCDVAVDLRDWQLPEAQPKAEPAESSS